MQIEKGDGSVAYTHKVLGIIAFVLLLMQVRLSSLRGDTHHVTGGSRHLLQLAAAGATGCAAGGRVACRRVRVACQTAERFKRHVAL